jgi:hypothetical protein
MIQIIANIAAKTAVQRVVVGITTTILASAAAEAIIASRVDDNAWENIKSMDDETKAPPKIKRVPGEVFTGLSNVGKSFQNIGYIVAVPLRWARYRRLSKRSTKADQAAHAEQDQVELSKLLAQADKIHNKSIRVLQKLLNKPEPARTKGEALYRRTVNKSMYSPDVLTHKYAAATKPEWLDLKRLTVSGDQIADQWIHGDTPLTNTELYNLYNGATTSLDSWLQQLAPMTRHQLNAFKLGVQTRISHEIRLGNLTFTKEATNENQSKSTAKEAK